MAPRQDKLDTLRPSCASHAGARNAAIAGRWRAIRRSAVPCPWIVRLRAYEVQIRVHGRPRCAALLAGVCFLCFLLSPAAADLDGDPGSAVYFARSGGGFHSASISRIDFAISARLGRRLICFIIAAPYTDATSFFMSPTRQNVPRPFPSFTDCGKRPDRTPSHQQDFLTGTMAGVPCRGRFGPLPRLRFSSACSSVTLSCPMICDRFRKPVSGSWCILDCPCPS